MHFLFHHKKFFLVLFWLWVFVIIIFSIIPNVHTMKVEIDNTLYRTDYLIHFSVYFGMSVLFLLSRGKKIFKAKPITLIWFVIGGIFLAGLSEFVQAFIPGRTLNPIDLLFNVLGVISGLISPRLLFRKPLQ